MKGKERKIRHYIYSFKPVDSDDYKLKIEFNKSNVKKEEIISILEEILIKLKS